MVTCITDPLRIADGLRFSLCRLEPCVTSPTKKGSRGHWGSASQNIKRKVENLVYMCVEFRIAHDSVAILILKSNDGPQRSGTHLGRGGRGRLGGGPGQGGR